MPTGALLPIWRWLITNNGVFAPGAKLFTYASGGSTPLPTYTTSALTGGAAHANPVIADAEGVLPVIYLLPQAYRIEVQDSTGAVIFAAQDNIYDFGQFAAAAGITATVLGVLGTSGTAGQSVYLSDGSGALTAGRWYLTDADFTYASSLAPKTGILLASGIAGDSVLVAVDGRVTNQSGLAAGSTYYASATAGALTSTAPTNARIIGAADSATSLVLANSPIGQIASIDNTVDDGRLTLTTGVPVTVTDVSAAVTAYYTPYVGNRIALYDGTTWNLRTFAELTISLAGLTASKPYDIFAYDNGGVVTIETLIWTSATARATALTFQNGVLVKNGATTRRYLGTIYINASGGQTDDTLAKRYVYSYKNRVPRALLRNETTATWTYTTATYRQANAAAANQLETMVGYAEDAIDVNVYGNAEGATASFIAVGVGVDSTSVVASGCIQATPRLPGTSTQVPTHARLVTVPAVGLHTFVWLEWSTASGTTTWQGDNGEIQSGIAALWRC